VAKVATPKIGLRSSQRRNLRFGLVNVGLSMAPALDADARVKGRTLDPTTLTPLKQQYVNEAGEVIEYRDRVTGYEYGDGFVVLDDDEVVKADADDTIVLSANIPAADVPAEWCDKTYLAWPTDATHNDSYALVSHYLRQYGRAFIGETVANGTTKVLAIRWSDTYGTLIAQQLSYAAQVRWGNIEILHNGLAEIADPQEAHAEMAKAIFDAIPDTFAWDEVVDDYGESLIAAIAEKGETGTVTARTAEASAPAHTDLLAALTASLPAKAEKKGKVKV
jgi:Ku protein